MSKKDDFANPADFSSFETDFQKVEDDYFSQCVEKELIFYGNVTLSQVQSMDFLDAKVHIKGNFLVNDDYCNICDGTFIIDGDLWVNGKLILSGEEDQVNLEVKGNIYIAGSLIISDCCTISAKNMKVNKCLIVYSDDPYCMDIKENLFVGGVYVGDYSPAVGGTFYGTYHEM